MGYRIFYILFIVCLIIPFTHGCGDDGDYKGVGKLVADRHEARKALHANKKLNTSKTPSSSKEDSSSPPKETSKMIFQEEAQLVSLDSGKIIGHVTVYMDKSGKIINIRLRK